MIFDRKKWTMDTLINDVKTGRVAKSQAILWVNLYVAKGFFNDTDVAEFETATAEPIAEESVMEMAEEIEEEIESPAEVTE